MTATRVRACPASGREVVGRGRARRSKSTRCPECGQPVETTSGGVRYRKHRGR